MKEPKLAGALLAIWRLLRPYRKQFLLGIVLITINRAASLAIP